MNELLSFSRVLEEKLRQSPFTTHEQIGRQIALFARMVQDYDDSLMGGGRWHTSGELKAADQQRDNAQSCFLKQIRIYANHYDAERRTQGQLLAILAQKYADKTRISHSEQTSLVENLIQEAESERYWAAVAALPELVPYAADRLNSWLDPFADPLGDGHQTIQSLYAIGSGGAAGLGLGNSRQKHLFVPEPQNDFIFSILCEELGFLGACAVILLFSALLWRGITLAAHAPDRFGALLVVGFVVQVALQAVLNIAVVTNTIPNTGISLPFFSSGGTSLMMLLGEMGIVLSVSRGES